ncbi:MAG TPA: helix-turn-helix domain-containing protein [Dehalococcoidia bacterium]|nr:helix-turn-helix domain-containing protein [Dehalococcoidia bacterium]
MTTERLAYRPAEAGRLLGVSRETVFALIQRGELRSFKVGAGRFISADELAAFIRRREAEAAGASA